MTPTRKRRLIVISLIVVAVAVAATLTVFALQQNMTYLFSPSEVHEGHAPKDARFRLGGVVEEHSVKRSGDSLEVAFVVTDRFQTIPVEYTGILPDLFREGQSIVATGAMKDGRFVATEVLAKHDETYMPPEVADAIAKAKAKSRESGMGNGESPQP
jgi:cytochrome c-type biogenesis protein CcmE